MTPINNAASIHQRILNKAAADHRPFNELLQYYAIERFLYRLGESPHCKHFVLKGALVFLALASSPHPPRHPADKWADRGRIRPILMGIELARPFEVSRLRI